VQMPSFHPILRRIQLSTNSFYSYSPLFFLKREHPYKIKRDALRLELLIKSELSPK
jgi:hypothetical protein